MSLHQYLKSSKDQATYSGSPFLSDPITESSESARAIVMAANEQVEAVLAKKTTRKRSSSYNKWDPETKAKIAHSAAENGNKAAATKFLSALGPTLHESTTRIFKRAYYEKLKSTKDPDKITELEGRKGDQHCTLKKWNSL